MNAVSNSIVKRDDTGDGIIELSVGDLMKLESGDLIDPEASDDVSSDENAIAPNYTSNGKIPLFSNKRSDQARLNLHQDYNPESCIVF